MRCKYNLEDIIKYAEKNLCKEESEEIEEHLKSCDKCNTIYNSINLTNHYVNSNVNYKESVLHSIEKSLDKKRYINRKKWLFSIDRFIVNNRKVIRSTLTIACIIFIMMLFFKNTEIDFKEVILSLKENVNYNEAGAGDAKEQDIPSEKDEEQDLLGEEIKEDGVDDYIQSPDGKMFAKVVRRDVGIFDSILITDKQEESYKVVLENIIYTGINDFYWVNNNLIALCGHKNPSANIYVVVDAYYKEIIGEYYGLAFTWNKNKDKLYYVKTSPHFGSVSIGDKIVDTEGNVYYETDESELLTSSLAISEDELNFVFFVRESNAYGYKLVIAKMGDDKKLKKMAELNTSYGEIKFIDNISFTITDIEGGIKKYSIEDL
ncbi:UNVERIFIED_CONTAM: hypothetical protein Cloal_1468 [Acetivibrio alkalicellulosi]